MAEIIDDRNAPIEGAMKMSSEFTFNDGVPDGTKLSFPENGSQLVIVPDSGKPLEGTSGVMVFNKDGMMTEKGHLVMIWQTQDGKNKGTILANFITPTEKAQALLDLPDFQGAGWGGWAGPV